MKEKNIETQTQLNLLGKAVYITSDNARLDDAVNAII